jgi:hydrogenase maturation protein HypF
MARGLVESGQAKAVALSGGCFQNAVLTRAVLWGLEGLPVLTHRTIPANDGGLALGQALIAGAESC